MSIHAAALTVAHTSTRAAASSEQDRIHSRLANLVGMLHGWVSRDDSYEIVIALRANESVATFDAICRALNADGMVVSARIANEVRFVGEHLNASPEQYAYVSYYAAA